MSDYPGSIAYLRMMAERCRRAAEELRGEDAEYLVDLAQRFEGRLVERERADMVVADED